MVTLQGSRDKPVLHKGGSSDPGIPSFHFEGLSVCQHSHAPRACTASPKRPTSMTTTPSPTVTPSSSLTATGSSSGSATPAASSSCTPTQSGTPPPPSYMVILIIFPFHPLLFFPLPCKATIATHGTSSSTPSATPSASASRVWIEIGMPLYKKAAPATHPCQLWRQDNGNASRKGLSEKHL